MARPATRRTRERAAWLEWLEGLDGALVEHAGAFAGIWSAGGIAVLVHDLIIGGPVTDPEQTIATFGGKRGEYAFRMSESCRRRILDCTDPVTMTWLARTQGDRVIVLTGPGSSFLLNHVDGRWSFEPGSTDGEREAAKS